MKKSLTDNREARAVIVTGALLASLVVALWLAIDRPHEPASAAAEPVAAQAVAVERTAAPTPAAAPTRTSASPTAGFARSLRGTEVDGDLEVGPDGHFVPTRAALRLFKFFLTAEGEEDASAIRAHVQDVARSRLPKREADAAMALFDRYNDYRRDLKDAYGKLSGPVDPRTAIGIAQQMQVALFGSKDADALFGVDNALAEVTVERAELFARQDLDANDRAARLAALEERLPASMRPGRLERRQVAQLVHE
jgi:lipase chaperone LimK